VKSGLAHPDPSKEGIKKSKHLERPECTPIFSPLDEDRKNKSEPRGNRFFEDLHTNPQEKAVQSKLAGVSFAPFDNFFSPGTFYYW